MGDEQNIVAVRQYDKVSRTAVDVTIPNAAATLRAVTSPAPRSDKLHWLHYLEPLTHQHREEVVYLFQSAQH
jgi:hypothetical protein